MIIIIIFVIIIDSFDMVYLKRSNSDSFLLSMHIITIVIIKNCI